jgi:NADH dehydrogenase
VRDLFRKGLKLGESMARLPWRAARRVGQGRSERLVRAADLGERLGTLPFRAADTALRPGEAAPRRESPPARARIVVLGAGYAGLTCFLELQDHLPRGYDLVLINADKYHWFTTELHTFVAGEDQETVRIPLSRIVAAPGRLVVGRVARVHPAEQQVELNDGERISYDLLVFALGSDPEYYGLPGVAEHSLIVGNWQSATKLRERIAALVKGDGDGDPRQLAQVIVAGGGLTGVEVAGELADELGEHLAITIVEAGPEIMGSFAPPLIKTAREVLEGKGITIRTGNPIVNVAPNQLHFADGAVLPFDLLVWAGGVRGSGILGESGLETTAKGRGVVDTFLRAVGYDQLYLIGDSAAFLDPATGREVPPTAQAAVQMGRATGQNILRRVRGQDEQPFAPALKGAFASLGRREGVGQIGEEHYTGLPAMVIKHLIEAHHAWETGGGVMPLFSRLMRAPRRYWKGRAPAPSPGRRLPQVVAPGRAEDHPPT